MKTKYILQALFLGPAVMLLDYPKYKKKIWITFFLSLLSLGILYFVLFWPLTLLQAIFRPAPKLNNKNNPFKDSSNVKSKPFKLLVFISIISYTALYGFIIYTLADLLVHLAIGSLTDQFTKIYYSLWVLVMFLFIAVPLFIISYLKLQSRLGRTINTFFLLGICTSIFVSVLTIRSSTNDYVSNNQGCDKNSTLQRARRATYPILTKNSLGTGYAIDNEGSIVTAYHVIEGANEVYINLSTGKIGAKVIRTLPEYDLAMIRAEGFRTDSVNLYTNYDLTEEVYAIGWPANTFTSGGSSITKGIVSRIIKSTANNKDYGLPEDFKLIQTDAAVNPGNSGGPLVNACGVIGTVLAKSDTRVLQDYGIASEEGISYAIGAELVKKLLSQ